MSAPTVHVVIVNMTGKPKAPIQCLVSVDNQQYAGEVISEMIPYAPGDSGGTFLSVAQSWLRKKAQFGCVITTSCSMAPSRLVDQVALCLKDNLSACYGDSVDMTSNGVVLARDQYREFNAEMIGLETIPPEVMMFDLHKFREAGGFDHMLAGSHKPDAYLVAMAAVGGRIKRLPQIVLHRAVGAGRYGEGGSSPLAWHDEESEDFWQRFHIDRFVHQACEHYRSMGW